MVATSSELKKALCNWAQEITVDPRESKLTGVCMAATVTEKMNEQDSGVEVVRDAWQREAILSYVPSFASPCERSYKQVYNEFLG